MTQLITGAVYWLGPAAGIQWRIRPIALRLIRVSEKTSWAGNAYLDGYELGPVGNRVEPVEWRRCLVTDVDGVLRMRTWAQLLQHLGLDPADYPAPAGPAATGQQRRRPTNTSPSIPQQRATNRVREGSR